MNEPLEQSDRPKSTPVGRLLRRWVKVHCDLYDFGRSGIDGVLQPPTAALERHLNATRWQDRLQPQRLWHLAAHRIGDAELLLAPKRRATGRAPAITRCYKIAIGADGTSAEAILDWLNGLHRELLYCEREPDAIYCYATYVLPWRRRHTGDREKVYMGAAATNAALRDFDRWLTTAVSAGGWGDAVEVSGTFTETTRDARGKKRVVDGRRAQLFRAPKCPDGDAFLRLRLSHFAAREVPWLWDAAERDDWFPPVHAAHDARWQPRTPELRGAVFDSLRYYFGLTLPRHPLRPDQLAAIEQRAAELWRERPDRGVYTFTPDGTVEQLIRRFVRRVLRKWAGPAGWSNKTLHFGAFAIEEAEALIRSRISKAALRALNCNPKLRWARVTYRALAVALCTIAKNSLVNKEFVPTRSVRKMLKYWGIGENGSLVKVLFGALIDARLIHCTNPGYGEGVCRRFAVEDDVILGLDFLSPVREKVRRRVEGSGSAPPSGGQAVAMLDTDAPGSACIGLRFRCAHPIHEPMVVAAEGPNVPFRGRPDDSGDQRTNSTREHCAPS